MKQAVILAAGEGRRLRPFTVNKPKAMISIAGAPILQYVVESLAQNGIRDIVLVVGYRKEQIFDCMGSGEQFGVDIKYVTQERQLGTTHALSKAKAAVNDEFLVLPGDKLIEADTIAQIAAARPEAILVKKMEDPFRSAVVTIENGMIKEATRPERRVSTQSREPGIQIVNTGIYCLSRAILDYLKDEPSIPAALNSVIADGGKIRALETASTWLDVVYPWDILSLNGAVLRRVQGQLGGIIETGVTIKGLVSVDENTIIKSNCYIAGPVVIGRGCEIGPNVCILPATSIGDNVVIAPFTEVENSVIGSDVSVGPGSIIQDSVIDKGCAITGHLSAISGETEIKIDGYHRVKVGAMLGEGCSLGSNVVAMPGVIAGNYTQVKALKLISGQTPDRSLVV
ncbi:MAG: NTP transferase domain-containing protein [Dehalococcoidales bacterium]|nr:NTP transferase domain-containing protein [Dehalococcoidales bacterium]